MISYSFLGDINLSKLEELKKVFQKNKGNEITVFYGNEDNQFSFNGTVTSVKEERGFTRVSIKRSSSISTELVLEGQWDAIIKIQLGGKIIYQK